MEFEVTEKVSLPDGAYSGVISEVAYRLEPYQYTDVFVKEDKSGQEVKLGCPSRISEETKLGKLLMSFGVKLIPRTRIDPEKELIGKKCSFMILNEQTDKGVFARIIDGSLKPLA